ncbi:mannose-1-phosphate guanylyltransferase [Flavicella sp.]|uniref:mannose-1-phosphate guanylyltransferase n=1 Tax=Flavicella sp. TaxID=2957742 RepID=UPI00262F7E9C|nr:mannose-1-phosphate guanylyltransferase [Flavicella sp.]MDG1804728.1 mannose-1-phosphate guanylyltransferase [Flavicella sp.]
MNKNNYAVIMAGGIGSRFWPISTSETPKQFHDMLGAGVSLIQKTFARLESLVPSENVIIATNGKYKDIVLRQLPSISENQLFLEPAMRNTAPCILATALKVHSQNPDGVMIIAPSDHWIEDEEEFIRNIQTSYDACNEAEILMTLGIKPNSPNTGYGYIQFNEDSSEIKKVKQFTEKPNLEKAKEFLAQGDYLWNAGIFVWSAKSIIKAFQDHLPEMYALFQEGESTWNTDKEQAFVDANYAKAQNISIDFGIIEKANNVHVLPVEFGWNDLGTWGSLYDKKAESKSENVTIGGEAIYRESEGNIVKTQSHKKVVIQGLSNFIVAEKDGVLLICPKENEQEIKEIAAQAKDQFGEI